MKRFFLIDLENVGRQCLQGIETLGIEDTVVICHNRMVRKDIPKDIIEKLQYSKATVKTMYIDNEYKNAMDFDLCVELGFLVAEYKNTAKYYIVSNDKGFDVAAGFVSSKGFHADIRRITTIKADYDAQKEEQQLRDTVAGLLPEYNSYEVKMVLKGLGCCKTTSSFHNYLKDHLKTNIYKDVYTKCKCLVTA